MIPEDLMRKYKYSYVHSCKMLNEPLVKDLLKENQELKNQLEDKEDFINKLQATKDKLDKWDRENYYQQKEFIDWLENGINQVKNTEFLDERIQRAGLVAYNRVLSKYKKINHIADMEQMVGGKDVKK